MKSTTGIDVHNANKTYMWVKQSSGPLSSVLSAIAISNYQKKNKLHRKKDHRTFNIITCLILGLMPVAFFIAPKIIQKNKKADEKKAQSRRQLALPVRQISFLNPLSDGQNAGIEYGKSHPTPPSVSELQEIIDKRMALYDKYNQSATNSRLTIIPPTGSKKPIRHLAKNPKLSDKNYVERSSYIKLYEQGFKEGFLQSTTPAFPQKNSHKTNLTL